MASATGIPEARADTAGLGEEEPLIGRAGDASQPSDRSISYNLIIGTAVLAQAGIVLLTALVWASVFLHQLSLFSFHPILNSTGVLLLCESILILQPTHTAEQKRSGTIVHALTNNFALDFLVAGLVIIEYNKFSHNAFHFTSVHGVLGLITYIFMMLQALVGFTQYFVPALFGGVNNAKAIYKWHRLSGYIVLVLVLATVAAATQTDTARGLLKLKLWAVLVSSVLILVGIIPRIKKQKFGLGPRPSGAFGQ